MLKWFSLALIRYYILALVRYYIFSKLGILNEFSARHMCGPQALKKLFGISGNFSGPVNGSEIDCSLLPASREFMDCLLISDGINFAGNKVSCRMSPQGKMHQHLNCEGETRFSFLY